jgi:hypothetical protein
MHKSLSSGAVSSAREQPALLVYLAREYRNYLCLWKVVVCFSALTRVSAAELRHGQALYIYMLVDGVKVGNDGVHCPSGPLPFSIFKAMIGVALGWKWRCFAGILTFGFLGIARPGEPLAAFRKDLILPRDMLSEDGGMAYLRILKPKTIDSEAVDGLSTYQFMTTSSSCC